MGRGSLLASTVCRSYYNACFHIYLIHLPALQLISLETDLQEIDVRAIRFL